MIPGRSTQFPYPYNKFYGGHSKEDPPVPIPNTEVKLFSADGTARATVWESRSSPYFLIKAPIKIYLGWGFFAFNALLVEGFYR